MSLSKNRLFYLSGKCNEHPHRKIVAAGSSSLQTNNRLRSLSPYHNQSSHNVAGTAEYVAHVLERFSPPAASRPEPASIVSHSVNGVPKSVRHGPGVYTVATYRRGRAGRKIATASKETGSNEDSCAGVGRGYILYTSGPAADTCPRRDPSPTVAIRRPFCPHLAPPHRTETPESTHERVQSSDRLLWLLRPCSLATRGGLNAGSFSV